MKPTMQQMVETARRLATDFLESERHTPVRPYREPNTAADELDLTIRREGTDLESLARHLAALLGATPTTASRRFFNQLFGGREPAATLGDMLACIVNSSMYTYKAAGPQVLIERELVRKMSSLVGYEHAGGTFTPGGSLSNLAAMIVARNEMFPGSRENGLGAQKPVVYASAECHYSIRKAAGMIGIGRNNVRFVPVDDEDRMDVSALRDLIEQDRKAHRTPFMVVATAGTTVLGAFDPISEIVEAAREHRIWMHIDGAFGGTALLSPQRRHLLKGCDQSDSFTWDAHKMMGVPLTCSVILTRKEGQLRASFNEPATYLFQQDTSELNPGTRSIQCGRRNDVLKLWSAWKHLGDDGYARRVERQFALTQQMVGMIESDPGLLLVCRPQLITVCFEVRNKPSDRICDQLDKQGRLEIGYGIVAGRRVIRIVLANPELTDDDLRAALAEIKDVGASLPDADNAAVHTDAAGGPE